MSGQQINRVSGKALIVLSLTALFAVLSGYTQPPQPDEGTAAHIFQLSIVALVPAIVLFLATADWKERWQSARPLAVSIAALVLAFVRCAIVKNRAAQKARMSLVTARHLQQTFLLKRPIYSADDRYHSRCHSGSSDSRPAWCSASHRRVSGKLHSARRH